MCFSAAKAFLATETADKMGFYGEQDPQDLKDMYHPSQLEKRFGGGADSPTNFWPPFVGPEFYPNGDKSHLNFIKKEDYPRVLKENPELVRHPEFITGPSENTRDFVAGVPSGVQVEEDPDFIGDDEENAQMPNISQ